ncbi:MAG TPA: endonuclease domain-containing protein [Candidatus Kryptobacter bacterium]|nr:endonuclease domain-containing protein [Candidatus Kryptobacter bacterium]
MTKYRLKYAKGSIGKARAFRSRLTPTERKLWAGLRGNQFGAHFRRQVPLGPYFCDFLSVKAMLVVEVDGSQHYTKEGLAHDEERDAFLRRRGFTVLRFTDAEVLKNIDGVLQRIFEQVQGGE